MYCGILFCSVWIHIVFWCHAILGFVLSAPKRHSTRLPHLLILNLLGKFKIRVCRGFRGYVNPILCYFCIFSEFFCLFLQFSTLESCNIWFTVSLEYPSAYVHSCCSGKIQIQGLSGGFRGSINPILSHFCIFSEFFVFFFSLSHWNHVIFCLQLV